MSKVKLRTLLEQVFPQIPLKPTSIMVVSVDGLKLAEIGALADYVKSLPESNEKSRVPQAMSAAMMSWVSEFQEKFKEQP